MSRSHKDVLRALMPVTLGVNNQADMQIEGWHLDQVQAGAQVLLKEMFPDTCFGLLEDWERLLGLPDPCTGQPGTVAQRIEAVTAKWGEKRKISAAYLVSVAERLGFTATIENYAMRRYGQAVLGGDYIGPDWARTITVKAPAVAVKYRTYGAAVYGEPYSTWGFSALECAIMRLRPAHVYVVFSYTN